jgi:hypothetical protein
VAFYGGPVGRPHAPPQVPAGLRDGDVQATPIDFAVAALDETRLLEPIDQSRRGVLRQQHVALELERPEASFRRAVQLEQSVIPAKRRKARGLELRLDASSSAPDTRTSLAQA